MKTVPLSLLKVPFGRFQNPPHLQRGKVFGRYRFENLEAPQQREPVAREGCINIPTDLLDLGPFVVFEVENNNYLRDSAWRGGVVELPGCIL